MFAVDAGSLFSRSGPRLVDGLELLARLIHPEAFPGPLPDHAARRLEALPLRQTRPELRRPVCATGIGTARRASEEPALSLSKGCIPQSDNLRVGGSFSRRKAPAHTRRWWNASRGWANGRGRRGGSNYTVNTEIRCSSRPSLKGLRRVIHPFDATLADARDKLPLSHLTSLTQCLAPSRPPHALHTLFGS